MKHVRTQTSSLQSGSSRKQGSLQMWGATVGKACCVEGPLRCRPPRGWLTPQSPHVGKRPEGGNARWTQGLEGAGLAQRRGR